jgi:hypothetical protein
MKGSSLAKSFWVQHELSLLAVALLLAGCNCPAGRQRDAWSAMTCAAAGYACEPVLALEMLLLLLLLPMVRLAGHLPI